jgi:hypothetical protein
MATTTPNFGWSVPTSTDLVKDGATAIETLGDSIDASLVDLKGGTSGQVLAKNSNTDMDFVWVAQDDSNAIQNAIVDAKGDLIGASAADTPARLAVGTNGQVLTADSTTATGLKWAAASSGDTGPSFGVGLTSEQTITANTLTKVAFDQEDWDTNTNYDSTTYRFTPTTAGYYQINFVVQTSGATSGRIYKNGSEFMRIGYTALSNDPINGTSLIYCNGSTDYIEAYVNSTSTTVYSTDSVCYFSGSMTRSA